MGTFTKAPLARVKLGEAAEALHWRDRALLGVDEQPAFEAADRMVPGHLRFAQTDSDAPAPGA